MAEAHIDTIRVWAYVIVCVRCLPLLHFHFEKHDMLARPRLKFDQMCQLHSKVDVANPYDLLRPICVGA